MLQFSLASRVKGVINKLMIKFDRGKFIRSNFGYKKLMKNYNNFVNSKFHIIGGTKSNFFRVKKVPKLFWSSQKTFTLRPRPICLLMLIIGLTLFGVGEAFLVASGVGVSPWTVLADGIAKLTKMD